MITDHVPAVRLPLDHARVLTAARLLASRRLRPSRPRLCTTIVSRVPELTGRSLEQIEGQLHRGRFRPRDFKHQKAEPAATSTAGPA